MEIDFLSPRDPMPDPLFMDLTLRYRYTFRGEWGLGRALSVSAGPAGCRYGYIENCPMPGFNVMGALKVTL